MNLINVSCAFCGKKFFRPRGRFNEAKKFGWKQFCSTKKIKHQRNVPYPDGSYTADFLVGNKFIEFFGLTGELVKYDKNAEIKHGLAQKYKIDLIEIYSKDLFPINHLREIIKIN